jgi:hypothetical protein
MLAWLHSALGSPTIIRSGPAVIRQTGRARVLCPNLPDCHSRKEKFVWREMCRFRWPPIEHSFHDNCKFIKSILATIDMFLIYFRYLCIIGFS